MSGYNQKITIKEANQEDAVVLDSFIIQNAAAGGAEFLQSSLWREILQAEKKSAFCSFVLRNGEPAASLLATEKKFARFFSYLYAPRGPIFRSGLEPAEKAAVLSSLAAYFSSAGKYIFLRFEPLEIEGLPGPASRWPLIKSIDLQPKKTLLLDLGLSDEELLSAMHQKTRYNIRLAIKKGLRFEEAAFVGRSSGKNSSFESDFADFWRLMKKTSTRDSFGIHGEAHYRNLLLSGGENIRLYFVSYQGRRIASGIFSFFGGKATYLHGASDDEYKNLMAPYLLQFEVLKIARQRGCRLYDFYGIDEKKWPGVTRFKTGFGGFVFSYAGTYDLALKKNFYRFYLFLRKLRRLI